MRFSFVLSALAPAALLLAAAPSTCQAQAMMGWSAIEVTPPAGKVKAPATVPVQGAAARLTPNAAQPAPGQHLKGDSKPITGALEGLTQLRPVRFKFLPGQGDAGAQYGLLPADLARVYPELVRTNLLNGTQTINTSQLTPILVEAIKELHEQVLVLQGQQLQLAQAYADLVQASQAKGPAVLPTFLRRGRGTDKKLLPVPTAIQGDTITAE
jgi:hypothetical protein